MRSILLTLALSIFSCTSVASATEEGSGIIYGPNHAFSFKAPKGWILDNQSGVQQGLHAVFYPAGEAWHTSKVIAYARGIAKDEVIRDIPSYVNFTIQSFVKNGSVNYKGIFHKKIENTKKDRTADIYFYEGDQWGNYEAVGYFEEQQTINIVVLNCKNKDIFNKSLPTFYKLVESYFYITNNVKFENTPNKANHSDSQ